MNREESEAKTAARKAEKDAKVERRPSKLKWPMWPTPRGLHRCCFCHSRTSRATRRKRCRNKSIPQVHLEQEDKIKDMEKAREAELEAQEKANHKKELETARLRAVQERAQDLQAEKDPDRAKWHQEAKEREWRQREKAMLNKLKT
ncbi:uncharacterized protein LOC109282919 [Alligator mississippiensis]|uniref:uncharacterized protein LOC109282919 n=1 Tax=Alligator mississippiensis TaxID=8496 RepID=UPI0009071091|nr:uncharacterized protein LOC109282919 [Alligator mississippiensis]